MTKEQQIDVIHHINEMKSSIKSYLKWISIILAPLVIFFIGEAFYGAQKLSRVEAETNHLNKDVNTIKLDLKDLKKDIKISTKDYISTEKAQELAFEEKIDIISEDINNMEFFLSTKFKYVPVQRSGN